jgi:RNA polymerase sigma-70 factor (ECF subfamily)
MPPTDLQSRPCWKSVSQKPGATWTDEDLECVNGWLAENRSYFLTLTLGILRTLDHNSTAADAEEAFQDVLKNLAVYRFRTVRPSDGLASYVYSVIRNQCNKNIAKRNPLKATDNSTPELPDPRPNPEQLTSSAQTADILRGAIDNLPENYRTVIQLVDIEEHSIAEVARMTGSSISSVKTNRFRGRHILAAKLRASNVARGA